MEQVIQDPMLQAAPKGSAEAITASVIVPTFNGASRIGACLDALQPQLVGRNIEIVVVDDGSSDETSSVVKHHPSATLIQQANAGPAAARNRGALAAQGKILLFTDDDCIPMPNWLDAMLAPFLGSSEVVGVKGIYRTRQTSIAARFVQIEYEDKYRLMAGLPSIDFIDTYSAGFLRDRFLEMGGYDTSFPVACAEDVELSFRMSARGWIMKFTPAAIVYHTHPSSLRSYLKKKYKFAFWRVIAVRKNPSKGIKDSHTPQTMKLQLLLLPAFLCALAFDLLVRPRLPTTLFVLVAFLLSTMSFTLRAIKKDPVIGMLSPLLLAARACVQFLGVVSGILYAARLSTKKTTIPA